VLKLLHSLKKVLAVKKNPAAIFVAIQHGEHRFLKKSKHTKDFFFWDLYVVF
jgi:hypothetical protein